MDDALLSNDRQTRSPVFLKDGYGDLFLAVCTAIVHRHTQRASIFEDVELLVVELLEARQILGKRKSHCLVPEEKAGLLWQNLAQDHSFLQLQSSFRSRLPESSCFLLMYQL